MREGVLYPRNSRPLGICRMDPWRGEFHSPCELFNGVSRGYRGLR